MKELSTYQFNYNEYIRAKEKAKDESYGYERVGSYKQRTTRERLLNYLKGRPWADNKQLSYVLHISMSTVRYHLRKLQKDGVIVRYHSDEIKCDFWEIIKE